MRHGGMAAAGIILGATLALGVGCEQESKLNVVVEEGSNALHVNLPAVPTLPPPPPANHPDGAFTIYGVRHAALRDPSMFTKQQRVRGFIVSVYTPRTPDGRVCTERDRCEEERPHVYIADSRTERDPQRLMMVTGYATFQHEIDAAKRAARTGQAQAPTPGGIPGAQRSIPADFDEGAEVTVTGTLSRRAANGQADSNGLLEYISHQTNTPAPPPDPRARRQAAR